MDYWIGIVFGDMMNLIVVGTDGFAEQVMEWICQINLQHPTYHILGMVGDEVGKRTRHFSYDRLGSIYDWKPIGDERYVCALLAPEDKHAAITRMKDKGALFESIVHPSCNLAQSCRIGEGTVIFPNATISANAVVGDFVTILFSGVGHDGRIGNFSTIGSGCDITGGVEIGECTWLYGEVIVTPKIKVGSHVTAQYGSTIVTNVRDGLSVTGSPARRIKA